MTMQTSLPPATRRTVFHAAGLTRGNGYRIETRFILWRGDGVLQVPSGALLRVGERWAVFVAHNGRAQRWGVELGHRSGLAAQVTHGLAAGDEAVAYPDDTLEDGARVVIRTPAQQPAL